MSDHRLPLPMASAWPSFVSYMHCRSWAKLDQTCLANSPTVRHGVCRTWHVLACGTATCDSDSAGL